MFRIEVAGPDLPSHAGLYGAGEARCRSAPEGPDLTSRYAFASVGVVVAGRFAYRSPIGAVEARPGTVLFGNADEDFSYRYHDTAGVRRAVLALDGDLLAEVAADCGCKAAAFAAAGVGGGRRAMALYGAVRRLAATPRAQEEAVVRVAAAALRREPARPSVGPNERRRVREVAAHLEDAYAEPHSLSGMAALAGLSRYHFIRAFRAATGETPQQFLIARRLRAAADRLLDGAEPVTTVAFAVGFNDLSHFNASFRRAFDATPSAWRRLDA
jgi:AraC-like DNA-binding protein